MRPAQVVAALASAAAIFASAEAVIEHVAHVDAEEELDETGEMLLSIASRYNTELRACEARLEERDDGIQ